MTEVLAQVPDLPWKEILAWTGGAAWIVLSGLFIKDIVRTSKSAKAELDRQAEASQRVIEGWRTLYYEAVADRGRWEKKEEETIAMLRTSVEINEVLLEKKGKQ